MKWCFIYNMVNWEYKKGVLYKRKLIEGIFGNKGKGMQWDVIW